MTTDTTTAARGDFIQLTDNEIDAVGGAGLFDCFGPSNAQLQQAVQNFFNWLFKR